MPSGYEYELDSEDYKADGSGTVVVLIHDRSINDLTSGMEQALDTNPGVISYKVSCYAR
jgi:hypothetical protein